MEELKIRNLTFFYPEREQPALRDVSLTIRSGEFVVLCGESGCGKSTLLRQLKPAIAPHGKKSGSILLDAVPLDSLDLRTQSQTIGFVQQSCDNQLVTDKVWHELAFGLESLGLPNEQIRRRVAEMASFFGMDSWFHKDVASLSGGQKQLLSLASVMVMQPSVLILDEPTSQLDPIAASEFLQTLGKINRELGTTVLLTEHRLEEAFSYATRVAVMERGELLCCDTPQNIGAFLQNGHHKMTYALPTAMRIHAGVSSDAPCPVTVREGKAWLSGYLSSHTLEKQLEELPQSPDTEAVVTAKDVRFRYEKNLPEVIRGLSLCVKRGEFFAILGGNGTGKSTTLRLLCGVLAANSGSIRTNGTVALLPQDPQTLFVKKTVLEDLYEIFPKAAAKDEKTQELVRRVVGLCHLEGLLSRHPYDLSGGEQQRAALAKLLLLRPQILLLDEPTKGLDAEFKLEFAEIIARLRAGGTTVIMVSHDVEFCAKNATRCALFFDGTILCEDETRRFFSGNRFYTTAASRMASFCISEAVTPEDVILSLGGTVEEKPEIGEGFSFPEDGQTPPEKKPEGLPLWRKMLGGIFGIGALFLLIRILKTKDLSALLMDGALTAPAFSELWVYALFLLCLLACAFLLARRSAPMAQTVFEKKALSLRTKAAAAMILLAVPLTLFVGSAVFSDRKYYFTALLVLLECSLPFFLVFEKRRPQARELVIIAVLCAVGIAGRAAFFMLPSFKPVMALCILAGIAFGGETGFIVGAVTMLLSNVLFSQGPWTPWQMFAMGIIGFLAGIIFRKGLLARRRLSMALFGAICAVVIYGGIMNFSSALLWAGTLNRQILLTYYVSGLPVDLVHAIATFFFLYVGGEPILEKLDRIKVKYGLIES